MTFEAPFTTSLHAAFGMADGARLSTMMFTIMTTRMRGGTG